MTEEEQRAGGQESDTYTQIQAKVADQRTQDRVALVAESKERKKLDDERYMKSKPQKVFPAPAKMQQLTLFKSIVEAYSKGHLKPSQLVPAIDNMAKHIGLKHYKSLRDTAARVTALWYALQNDDAVRITLTPAEHSYTYVDSKGKPWNSKRSQGVRVLKEQKTIRSGKHFIVDRTSYFIWAKSQLTKEIEND